MLEDGMEAETAALAVAPVNPDAHALAPIHQQGVVAALAAVQGSLDSSEAGQAIKCRIPVMVGKVGQGRHGDKRDRQLLAYHMRTSKMLRKNSDFRCQVADMLQDCCFTKDGKLLAIRAKATESGIVLSLQQSSKKGNRYKRVIPWVKFLEASFGKLNRSSHIAISLDVSQRSVKFMTTLVSQIFMNQQCVLLAKLIALCSKHQPKAFIKQIKWDETQLLCSLNADKSEQRVQSTWQVMAVRLKVVLVCSSGQILVFRVVMPPVVLLASGAHHIYYGLRYHPVYHAVNHLLDLLAKTCQHRVCIWESDGAYSNERLMGHLINKNKSADIKVLNIHCKCQNHQAQLLNVSLLACCGHNILNRLYGLAVFLRNLGHWLRMRQALADWVSETLEFKPEVFSSQLEDHIQPSEALVELVGFIRSSRNMESPEQHQSFDQKARDFLDMWNGDSSTIFPVHICSHRGMPADQRHCQCRQDAVRKCVKTFLDLFMIMPCVPAPDKWTTMFGCIDFVLSGVVIHKWLPAVFRRAFRDMTFQEFDDTMATMDPKLVETLSFHAVNGRRHDSSLEFLTSDASMWALRLLALAMEPSRALTWFWLSCLGHLFLFRLFWKTPSFVDSLSGL